MEVTQIISVQIIPVILLPVTGLICLCFYNRFAVINQRIRFLQKEMRELMQGGSFSAEWTEILDREMSITHRRSTLILFSLVSCLLAIAFFSFTALFIALGIYFSWAVHVAITFWFIGPFLILLGIVCGIAELILSTQALKAQSKLIEKWGQDRN